MAGKSDVKHTMAQIRMNSTILKESEDIGEIKIVGGVYDGLSCCYFVRVKFVCKFPQSESGLGAPSNRFLLY